MSYHRKTTLGPKGRNLPMGDAASAISVANDVIHDPYFNEAVCRVKQLQAIENRQAVPVCAKTAPNIGGGVGLRAAMPALRGYVYASQKPFKWPLWAAVAGAVGVPMLIGYALGKGSK
jgi:hypothetical protein